MDTALPRPRQASRRYAVRRLTDREEIRPLLAADRAYAAYALAQLEPNLFPLSEWFAARGAAGDALLVHARSGLGHALFAMGEAEALDALLALHPGPRFTFASVRPEHRPAVQRHFLMTRPQTMLRMAVDRDSFAPPQGEAVRLRGSDAALVNRLYSSEGGATAYSPRHIEDGVYYGVFAEGALVSIAGTHVVAPGEGVAVVGNVFTHPRYRGRGLATVATGATTQALLRRCALVALTVEEENAAGIRVYQRLGYKTRCTMHETPLIRKEPLGLLSLTRRLLAGWRGRGEGLEVVG